MRRHGARIPGHTNSANFEAAPARGLMAFSAPPSVSHLHGAMSGGRRQGGASNHIMMPASAAIAAARRTMRRNVFAAGMPPRCCSSGVKRLLKGWRAELAGAAHPCFSEVLVRLGARGDGREIELQNRCIATVLTRQNQRYQILKRAGLGLVPRRADCRLLIAGSVWACISRPRFAPRRASLHASRPEHHVARRPVLRSTAANARLAVVMVQMEASNTLST
jgi:hypothetical protein